MRWVTFIFLVAVVLALQTTIAPRIEWAGVRPDWLLVLVVFYGLHARTPDSILAAWILGAAADLLTLEGMGFLALSYALIALLVAGVREYLFRQLGLTQFLVTFLASLLLCSTWLVYRRVSYGGADALGSAWLTDVLLASIYTAIFAPPCHWILLRYAGLLGVVRPKYSFRGPQRSVSRHV